MQSNETTLGRKRTAVAAVAMVAVGSAAAPVIFPASAMANHPAASCAGNALCEWQDPGFRGAVQWWNPRGSDNTYGNNTFASNPSVPLNDRISSVWNNSNRYVKLFVGASGTGASLCLPPGGAASDLSLIPLGGGLDPGNWTDEITSHYTASIPFSGCTVTKGDQGCSM